MEECECARCAEGELYLDPTLSTVIVQLFTLTILCIPSQLPLDQPQPTARIPGQERTQRVNIKLFSKCAVYYYMTQTDLVDLQADIAEDQFLTIIAPRGRDTIHLHTR